MTHNGYDGWLERPDFGRETEPDPGGNFTWSGNANMDPTYWVQCSPTGSGATFGFGGDIDDEK